MTGTRLRRGARGSPTTPGGMRLSIDEARDAAREEGEEKSAVSGELRFPSPFEVETPLGAEGWQEMYPKHVLFSEERRESEEARLWFYNGMHFPEPMTPFDIITAESFYVAIGEMSARFFCIPPAMGIDFRVLNGYVYINSIPVLDPQEVQERAQLFQRRAGHYYANWERIYEGWRERVKQEIAALRAVSFPELPDIEPDELVFAERGIGTSMSVLEGYNRVIESLFRLAQIHSEIVMIGFAAYLTFYDFCKQAFPEISDQQITGMIGAIDVSMLRPDEEFKALARRAVELGIADKFVEGRDWQEVFAELRQSDAGQAWLREWDERSDPWFYVNSGGGLQHHFRAWVDDPSPIFGALIDYIRRVERGENLERDIEAQRQERDRITAEYRELLRTDEDRKAFDELIGLVRKVYFSIEDHRFFADHWYMSTFWNKLRELGQLFVDHGFFREVDDMFYLHWTEVSQALTDLLLSWSVGGEALGPRHWPSVVERRKAILAKLRKFNPPPALGVVPETIADPAIVMLWGITPDRLRAWLTPADGDGNILRGFPASSGTVEGPARVISSVNELETVQDGEILVCPVTEPSWAPIFTKVRGTVTDIGGVMSHAAIVTREYNIPAVLGTGVATKRIRTGQRIRVDGDQGIVTILD